MASLRCLGVFFVMWVPKLLLCPVKIRIFCPKTTKFGPKLAFLVIFGQALLSHLVPCCWVGWWLWRAGCISQTPIYFIFIILDERKMNVFQTVVSSVLVLCGEVFSLEVDVIVDRLLGWTSALPGLLMELHD